MIPLTELRPAFRGNLRPRSGEALEFDCPGCLARGRQHTVRVVFANPLDGGAPMPGAGETRWVREGDAPEALTLAPSILYPCWHGWVEDGVVISVDEAPAVIVRRSGPPVALSPRQWAALKRQMGIQD